MITKVNCKLLLFKILSFQKFEKKNHSSGCCLSLTETFESETSEPSFFIEKKYLLLEFSYSFYYTRSRPKGALRLVINCVWFYSVFSWEIETKTTFSTFLTALVSLILSARISMYGWREPLIHLNMMQDRIGPAIRKTEPVDIVIHNVLRACFSMSIVPMDSSSSQCLWVTVMARTKN